MGASSGPTLLALPAAGGCRLRASSLSLGLDRQEGRPHELLWLRVVTGVRRWWDPSCHTEGVRGSRGPGQPHPASWELPNSQASHPDTLSSASNPGF